MTPEELKELGYTDEEIRYIKSGKIRIANLDDQMEEDIESDREVDNTQKIKNMERIDLSRIV